MLILFSGTVFIWYSIVHHHICLFCFLLSFFQLNLVDLSQKLNERNIERWMKSERSIVMIDTLKFINRACAPARAIETQVSFYFEETVRIQQNCVMICVYHVKKYRLFGCIFLFHLLFIHIFCLFDRSFQFNARPIVIFMHGLM